MWAVLSLLKPNGRVRRAPGRGVRPRVQALEDRSCPSGGVFEWDDPTGGGLDPTFGSGGQVLTSFSNHYDAANAVVTQPDGKIVAVGNTWASGSKTGNDFLIARYNANGTLDPSFGAGGHTSTDFGSSVDRAEAVALQRQADGTTKIVAAGFTRSPTGEDEFALARYNPNGTLDATFGSKSGKGKVVTDLGGPATFVQSMAIDSSGRIIVAGVTTAPTATNSGQYHAALVRYNVNGSLDTTFGSGGKLITVINDYNQSASVALQADGKIVLACNTFDSSTGSSEFAVARFNTDGTADIGFGTGGIVTTHPGYTDQFGGVAVQADGKIVVSGSESSGYSPNVLYLIRYNPNGTLDAAFGSGGIVAVPPRAGYSIPNTAGNGVAVQADGMIVAGADVINLAQNLNAFAATRVDPTGTVDPGFGDGGWAIVQYTTAATVTTFALQPDGRILVAGYARPTSATYPTDVALVRFLASAPQIGSFTAAPNPVAAGGTTTLTASNVTDANPAAAVTRVGIYIVIDGTGVLLGYGTHNSDGSWSYAFDTTGYAPGTYTLYAQATDSYGVFGNPVALTLAIQ